MGFYDAYAIAINNLILNTESCLEKAGPESEEALKEVCRLLRVAKAEVVLCKTPYYNADNKRRGKFFYSNGEADMQHPYISCESTDKNSIIIYRLYPYQEAKEWSEEEKNCLNAFIKLLFTFHGKKYLLEMAETLNYLDRNLDVYNVHFFLKVTEDMIVAGKIDQYVACYFDLKRFSVINSQFGRETGTKLMKRFIDELQQKLGDAEYICRVSEDNFVMLCLKEHLELVMEYLNGKSIEVNLSGMKHLTLSAHAGYYMIPKECKDAEDVIDRARMAVNMAKYVRKVPHVFFDEAIMKSAEDKKRIESLFGEAIANEEFLVYYQPKVDLKQYSLTGAEALCRWRHNGEMIQPFRFIPVLEQSHLICTLDFYMLEHVCKDIRRWLDAGRPVVRVSVNLSRVHLGDVDLVEHVLAIVDKYKVPHEYIEIELTETTTDVDYKELKQIVSGLRGQGFSVAVDDFGVGYSSLNLIREIPWKVLKIDKSFLPEGKEENDEEMQKRVMLKHVIGMAQNLGLDCIAEGVETVEQVALLKENNCYYAQGYFFDRPLPVEEFEEKLAELA